MPKIYSATGGDFIDPANVGSSVSWQIKVTGVKPRPAEGDKREVKGHTYISGDVRLYDCSRGISWDIDGTDGLKKLDVAIAQLKAMRTHLVAAKRAREKFHKAHGIEWEDDSDE